MDEKEWREEDSPITITPVVFPKKVGMGGTYVRMPSDFHTWRNCPNPDCSYKHEGDPLDEF